MGEANKPQDRPQMGGQNFFEILEGGKISSPPPVLKSRPCMNTFTNKIPKTIINFAKIVPARTFSRIIIWNYNLQLSSYF